MKMRMILALAIPATLPIAYGCATALAQAKVEASSPTELVIYKNDFAMVRQERPVQLESGSSTMTIGDLSKQVDPNSIQIDFSNSMAKVASTTFDLGSNDQSSLVEKLDGQTVQVMLPSTNGQPGEMLEGVIEPSPGGFLLKTADKTYINPPGTLIAPKSAAVAFSPSLRAKVQAETGGAGNMQLSYLSRGLSWSADYVAKLQDETSMKLELWATVNNSTGTRFDDSKITFVAGAPNRAVTLTAHRREPQELSKAYASDMPGSPAPTLTMPAAPMGELYSYHAPSPASIASDQMNRVPMMESVTVPIVKDYGIDLPEVGSWNYGPEQRSSATVAIRFKNEQSSQLGVPLPAGAVRVYSSPSENSAYIGAASIDDTPKDAPVFLTLSKVFDVYAQSRAISTKKLTKHSIRKSFEVVVHNEKKSAIKVRLVQNISEPIAISESVKGVKLNQSQRQWTVTVPAGGQTMVKLTADFKV